MRYNLIKIADSKGHWFLMEIWTPSNWTRLKFWEGDASDREGDWQARDKGYLSVNSGDARRSSGIRSLRNIPNVIRDADLWLGRPGANDASPFVYGVILYDYDDGTGTNSSGDGEVVQPWVLALEPGKISWEKATYADLRDDAIRSTTKSP